MIRMWGLAGPSGAGKTNVAGLLAQMLGAGHIRLDDFMLDWVDMPVSEVEGLPNQEVPASLHLRELRHAVWSMAAGQWPVEVPVYSRVEGRRLGVRLHQAHASGWIVMEDFLLFDAEVLADELLPQLVVQVWLDVLPAEQWSRLLRRNPTLSRTYYERVIVPQYRARRADALSKAQHIISTDNLLPAEVVVLVRNCIA